MYILPQFKKSKEYYKKIFETVNSKDKEYTSQALINTKIAKLKEVAKKYPRSLIRSEVRRINTSSAQELYYQFGKDELPFQKLSKSPKEILQEKLNEITENIKKLYEIALQNPNKQFNVAYRNTVDRSLNGYTGLEMINMFIKAGSIPSNIVFSKEWVNTGKFGNIVQNTYHLGYTPTTPTQEQIENKQKECE